mgnify:CR=1 FL=1
MLFLAKTQVYWIVKIWYDEKKRRSFHGDERRIIAEAGLKGEVKAAPVKEAKAEKKETVSAITNYKILKQGRNFTLFELELDTGRKNQIRAHLSSIGYTICGDVNYRAKTNKFGRLALHARVLEFIHPVTKEKLRFEIPENESWSKI